VIRYARIGKDVMTKRFKIERDAKSRRFVIVPSDAPVGGFNAKYVGKLGSYSVRRVDNGRFKSATKAAISALRRARSSMG
jgi:hypothetical protein